MAGQLWLGVFHEVTVRTSGSKRPSGGSVGCRAGCILGLAWTQPRAARVLAPRGLARPRVTRQPARRRLSPGPTADATAAHWVWAKPGAWMWGPRLMQAPSPVSSPQAHPTRSSRSCGSSAAGPEAERRSEAQRWGPFTGTHRARPEQPGSWMGQQEGASAERRPLSRCSVLCPAQTSFKRRGKEINKM